MLVLIDGVQYVRWNETPQPAATWKLTKEHIAAVRGRVNACDGLLWAIECEATVDEMLAWLRSIDGAEPQPAGSKKVLPLPVPAKKPTKLFD